MTRNQLEYLRIQEQKRSNLVSENLTRLRDQRSYIYNMRSLDEATRHNLANEGLQAKSLDESARHNMVTESLSASSLYETSRSNLAREQETNRHNVALEQEGIRSNKENEAIRWAEFASTDAYRKSQVSLGYSNLAESSRHNKANEAEMVRSNKEHENITNRNNLLNYSLAAERNSDNRIQNKIENHQTDEQIHITARRDTVNAGKVLVDTLFKGASLIPAFGGIR